MDTQRIVLEIIRGERKAPIVSAGLKLLSYAYRLVIASRNLAYDQGIFPSKRLPAPVISVGNIAVGGTGKTPLIHLLATVLQDKVRLSILSRGYRSQIEQSQKIKKVSAGVGPLCSVQECGDEPYFLSQKTNASIWVGADRFLSGSRAIAEGANCLLLDDGMQHRRLKRDFEIIVVDGTDPFCKGRFLPWGLLRDSPKRLQKASLIVITHIKDLAHFQHIQTLISLFSDAPVVGAQVEVLNREDFTSSKVGLFCGIGQPKHFLQTARDLKSQIVDTLILKDHESLQAGQLEKFAINCQKLGAEILLCTEKDYVKLYGTLLGFVGLDGQTSNPSVTGRSLGVSGTHSALRSITSGALEDSLDPQNQAVRRALDLSLGLNIVPVKIALKIAFGKEHWEHLIDNILNKVRI